MLSVTPPKAGEEVATLVVAPQSEPDGDDRFREGLVGTWKQHETGVRWLRVRPDGTATMVIDPNWVARAIIGETLTVEIEWTVEEGRALFRSVSGKPESGFERLSALFGRDRDRTITELSEMKFVLLDEEDGSKSEWVRVTAGDAPPKTLRE